MHVFVVAIVSFCFCIFVGVAVSLSSLMSYCNEEFPKLRMTPKYTN